MPTRLSEQLSTGARPEVVHVFRCARRALIAGRRVDMGELAAAAGVDRTSLYRWVGNRDALVCEVLWSVAVPTLDRIDRAVRADGLLGAERVTAVLTRFVEAMIRAPFFRAYLQREPARALRLLTTAESQVQRRFVAVTETLVAEEADAGRLVVPLPHHDLAYLLVRVAESFTYADLITGERPEVARAAAALAFVLRPWGETRAGAL